MKTSETKRKWMNVTTVILLSLTLGPIFGFFLFLPNFMRDLNLRNSGAVAQGTIVGRKTDQSCSDSGYTSYDVQFIDNKGQTRVENVSQCNNTIGDLSVGDSISLLYAPDDPTVIAAQNGFTSQFQFDQSGVVDTVGILTWMIVAILLIQLIPFLSNRVRS
jgi:hypothetical protein